MADSQSNQKAKKKSRGDEQGERARGGGGSADSPLGKSIGRKKTRSGKSPGVNVVEEIATAGRAGERNLKIEWIDVWIDGNKPCCFNVTTLPENALEVEFEQAAYKKKYNANGAVKTDVTPIVPIGTRGKLTARDLSTGEVLERRWIWQSLGGSLSNWLVEAIRKLFGGS